MLQQGEKRAIVIGDITVAVRESSESVTRYNPADPRFWVQFLQVTEVDQNKAVCISINEKQVHLLRDFLNSL